MFEFIIGLFLISIGVLLFSGACILGVLQSKYDSNVTSKISVTYPRITRKKRERECTYEELEEMLMNDS